MQVLDKQLTFSPTDLVGFLECEHLTALERLRAAGELPVPPREDPQGDLLRRKGEEHEAAYLARLEAAGRTVLRVEVEKSQNGYRDYERAMAEAAAGMVSGFDAVYQAALVADGWRGLADFLERAEDGSYEAVDAKLARHAKPSHLLQLSFYSDVLGRLQGRRPECMHVELGSGLRESFRVGDFDAYYRRARNRFLRFVGARGDVYPYPVAHCPLCDFHQLCEQRWEADDHPIRVAGIRRSQIERLDGAGVTTLTALARLAPGTPIRRMRPEIVEGLRHQAKLQADGGLVADALDAGPGRGFGLLPRPSPGDVYFDIEGDPFYDSTGSLEYLFGIVTVDGGEPRFRAFWAHDREEEKRVFEELLRFLVERRRRWPDLHVYHYANYERAALQRLMSQHGVMEDEVDDLLRSEALVDLYRVVRQALRLSLPSYSLKKVEAFYLDGVRDTAVAEGGESVVVFERWLETGVQELLDEIEAYNRDDCVSTYGLHRWLLGLRPHGLPWRPRPDEWERSEGRQRQESEKEALQARLRDGAEEGDARWLAAELLDYHQRAAKPAWWDYFNRLTFDEQELIDDSAAIGGIRLDESIQPSLEKRSLVYTLRFPPQEFKVGRDAWDPRTEATPGTITEIDEGAGTIRLKRAKTRHKEPFPRALVPRKPLRDAEQRAALRRLAEAVDDESGSFRACQDVLARRLPRAPLHLPPVEVALRLSNDHLFIQGPPGSGKTYTGAEMAVALMAAGRHVGVSSLSHKAIDNFLGDVEMWAERKGVHFAGLKKCTQAGGRFESRTGAITNTADNAAFEEGCDANLIAGTAWLFAREGVQVDTLFIDEAGQVSLADALAMGTSTANLVLLGDPNQLAQVSQGVHPGCSRASVLQHLLGADETVPTERGIFLATTYRLRPEICEYVSTTFYEGRLEPAEVCFRRSVSTGNGLRSIEVQHTGNRQSSPEEAKVIAQEIERLLGGTYTDGSGDTRPLREDDFMVVAPYNAQVRCLRAHLPAGVPVGTVDKFQGQQAPVVFFSMTTSSGEDVPRGLDFLFSRLRLNVAVSRAQCLVYLVASPRLLEVNCRTVEQMRLVNAPCRLVELSRPVVGEEA